MCLIVVMTDTALPARRTMSSRDIRNLRSGRQALRRDPRSFRLAPHAPAGAPLENLDPARIAIRRAVQKAVHFDVQSCLTSAEGLAQTDSSRQEAIGEALTVCDRVGPALRRVRKRIDQVTSVKGV